MKRSTVKCMYKDRDLRCPFRLGIRGYFSAKTSGMNLVENIACGEDRYNVLDDPRFVENLFSVFGIMKHGAHSH